MEALKALQEKVKTDGKLKPWLAKHGLGRPARPVEPHPHRAGAGKPRWKPRLRERLGALEVSRLEMVRAFAGHDGQGAPPAKLAFYSARRSAGTAPRRD